MCQIAFRVYMSLLSCFLMFASKRSICKLAVAWILLTFLLDVHAIHTRILLSNLKMRDVVVHIP